MPASRKNPVLLIVVTVVVIAIAPWTAYLICDSYARANEENSLHRNGNWYNTKLLLEKRLAGAGAFMVTGNALHKDRLDLGTWCGFQEVVYKQPLPVGEVQFDFALPHKQSYLVFHFNRDESGSSGIRISRSPLFPSIFFVADALGKFHSRVPLDVSGQDDRWHSCSVTFDRQGAQASVVIDGAAIGKLDFESPNLQSIGFRNGHFPALIDNVEITTLDSDEPIRDSFELQQSFPLHVPIIAALLVLDVVVLVLAAWKTRSFVKGLFSLIMANVVILFSAFIFQQSLYHVLSARYTRDTDEIIAKLEVHGYDDKVPEGSFGVAEVKSKYDTQSMGPARILFLGGSQTWGAGATTESQTFVARIGEKLAEDGYPRACINAGVNGATSGDHRSLYEREWLRFEPKIVVLNMSTNDRSVEELANNVQYLLTINHRLGIQSIVVLEPLAIEQPNSDSCTGTQGGVLQSMKHDALRKVAEEFEVPVVDMHGHLAQEELYDSGFLWADDMHLSPYGQRLFADELYSVIRTALAPDGLQ